MGDVVVLLRILMGWLGIHLASSGVPPELVKMITADPVVLEALSGIVVKIAGGTLAASQIFWWRLAKRKGWTT